MQVQAPANVGQFLVKYEGVYRGHHDMPRVLLEQKKVVNPMMMIIITKRRHLKMTRSDFQFRRFY